MKGLVRAGMLLGLMCASATVFAAKVVYSVGPSGDFSSIQKAIAAASKDDVVTINVAVGTYDENITLRTDISLTLTGVETARTLLRARDNSKPIIDASGVNSSWITRFTFIGSTTGVQLGNNSAVTIAANVFNLGTGGTAVTATDKTDTSTITNNTFYANKLAVSRAGSSSIVQNNIFASNATGIASADVANGITYNLFFANTLDGQIGTSIVTSGDPLFVNIALHDFHLKATSAAINKGTGTGAVADVGAYGGAYSDPTPFPVQNVAISDSTATVAGKFTVTVSWAANASYLTASYILYYYFEGKAGDLPYNGSEAIPPSKTNVGNTVSVNMSGTVPASLNDTVVAPGLTSVIPQSQALKLAWNPVDNATSYEVHYGLNAVGENTVSVGNVVSYTLSGLQNKATYLVAVVAVRQPILHVAIKVQDTTTPVAHLSDYSIEQTKALGVATTSTESIIRTGIPEEVVAFPELPNEGCFIATAAYGSYSAAQVKTLRDFRDHYLLTNTPGRAFVRWYYANSPPAAHYLNQHPALKPVVRGLLLPFVFITSWLNGTTVEVQVAAIALLLVMGGLGFYWRRRRISWA